MFFRFVSHTRLTCSDDLQIDSYMTRLDKDLQAFQVELGSAPQESGPARNSTRSHGSYLVLHVFISR